MFYNIYISIGHVDDMDGRFSWLNILKTEEPETMNE